MAAEIAARELGECFVAGEGLARGHTRIDEGVSKLLALSRTAADHEVELGLHHVERETYSVAGDSGFLQRGGERRTRLEPVLGECFFDHAAAAHEIARLDAELPVIRGHAPLDVRAGEPLHPPQILRRDEVPRRPKNVRPHDQPIVERTEDGCLREPRRAEPERPRRRPELLRLHGTKPGHDLRRRTSRAHQPLIAQPQRRDVHGQRVGS